MVVIVVFVVLVADSTNRVRDGRARVFRLSHRTRRLLLLLLYHLCLSYDRLFHIVIELLHFVCY